MILSSLCGGFYTPVACQENNNCSINIAFAYFVGFQKASGTLSDDATFGHAAGHAAVASRLLAEPDQLAVSEQMRAERSGRWFGRGKRRAAVGTRVRLVILTNKYKAN